MKIFGGNDDEDKPDLIAVDEEKTDEDPYQTLRGESYEFNPGESSVERAGRYEVIEDTPEHGKVAGKKVRRMFERADIESDRPIWVGYDDGARRGFREAPIRLDALKIHLWLSGTTGSGKSTVLQNIGVQHAWRGHGFCNIDPKADGDTLELLQMLPSHRLDDVILIEPGSPEFDRTVAVNIIDVPAIENPERREKEIESRLQNLKAIFSRDDQLYATMRSVTETMGRGMLRHNAEVSLDPNRGPSDKYSIIDMYFILLDAMRREEFAATIDDPFVREFATEIAEMDDDDLRPLLKRIKGWVENAIIRRIISRRESTINWDDIVDNDRILLVRIPVESDDVHQMISLTVLRNLWSAKQRQARNDNRETKPYFLQIDEFEKVASDKIALDDMLVRARSKWLSVTLGTQYPQQIAKHHEETLDAMKNNCNNRLAMRTKGDQDARILMKDFQGYDADDLSNLARYRAWTKLPQEGGKYGEPVNIRTFAPYPPLRSPAEAKDAIRRQMQRFGAPPLSDDEIREQLQFGAYSEISQPGDPDDVVTAESVSSGPSTSRSGDLTAAREGELDVDDMADETINTILEGIYAAQLQSTDLGTPVPEWRAREEVEKRFESTGYKSVLSNAFEKIPKVSNERYSGEMHVSLTESGIKTVETKDTGSSATGGDSEHRLILQKAFRAFTALGALTTLPSQSESTSLPDGLADLPIDPTEGDILREIHELEAELKNKYPRLYEISRGQHISIEAETTTMEKPEHTLVNFRKAINSNRHCVFACKDGSSDQNRDFKYWGYRGDYIMYDVDDGTIDYTNFTCCKATDDNGNRTFYNKEGQFRIDDEAVAVLRRRESDLVWKETDDDEIIALVQSDDGYQDVVRLEDTDSVKNPSRNEVRAFRTKDDYGNWIVKKGESEFGPYETVDDLEEEWRMIAPPFVPEVEFDRMPTPEDFSIVIFPDSNNPDYQEPQLYRRGETEPLMDGNRSIQDPSGSEKSSTESEPKNSDSNNQNKDTGEVQSQSQEEVDSKRDSSQNSEAQDSEVQDSETNSETDFTESSQMFSDLLDSN